MDPRKAGNEMSKAYWAELLLTHTSPTCSCVKGCWHLGEWIMWHTSFFFCLLSYTDIPVCLSQICCPLICAEKGAIGLHWKQTSGPEGAANLHNGSSRFWESYVGGWLCSRLSLSQTLFTRALRLFVYISGVFIWIKRTSWWHSE